MSEAVAVDRKLPFVCREKSVGGKKGNPFVKLPPATAAAANANAKL